MISAVDSSIPIWGQIVMVEDEVTEKTRRVVAWLNQVGYRLAEASNAQALWVCSLVSANSIPVTLAIAKNKPDAIEIQVFIELEPALRQEFLLLNQSEQQKLQLTLREGLLQFDVFFLVGEGLATLTVNARIYDDGLTKDALMSRIRLVTRAAHFASLTIRSRFDFPLANIDNGTFH